MALVTTLPTGAPQSSDKPLVPRNSTAAFVLVTGLFFLWGIPNNLNDVLIRQFMTSFEITRLQAGLVQSAFYTGYFLFSVPAAMVMRRYGYKRGLLTGLVLYSMGTFLFLPAALARSYSLFLLALFVIASGLGFLETGANPLVAQLGEPETAVRRLNFSQAFNPLGAIAGVLIGTLFIFSGIELKAPDIARLKLAGTYDAYLQHETMRVIAPYLVLGAIVLLWAYFILRTPFPAIAGAANSEEPRGSYRELLRYPHFLLAVFAQFCYVGAQVGTWSYFIQYVQDYAHLPEKAAGYLLTGTLAGFGVGRFASSHWMRYVKPHRLMGLYSIINIGLVAAGILFPGWIGVWAIFLTSFFMSLMFPTIFALGLRDLGANTKPAASLLVMAIIGGAVFTPVIGLVFQASKSMAIAMSVPLVCYVCVALYSFWGSTLAPFSTPRLQSELGNLSMEKTGNPKTESNWEQELYRRLPAFGHRNWIVIADAAYPQHSNQGIETIVAGGDHLQAVQKTLSAISACKHIRGKMYTDLELDFVAESDAPGVSRFRKQLQELLKNAGTQLPHEQIILRLDECARAFRVLIVKTALTIPYTSVFFELDCGYWNAEAEQRLRNSLRAPQEHGVS